LALHDFFDCTHKAHRLMNHDIFDCTAMPFFYCVTLFLFSPCMLIVRSITIFWVPPRCPSFGTSSYFCLHHVCSSFGAPRYFVSTAMPIFLKHHDIFVCNELLLISKSNTVFSCAAIGCTDVGTPQNMARTRLLEIMTRWPRQRATRCYTRHPSLNSALPFPSF